MKQLFDIVQTFLSMPGIFGIIGSFVFVLAVVQLCKSFSEVWTAVLFLARWLSARVIRVTWGRFVIYSLLSVLVFFSRTIVVGQLQYLEQVIDPAYITADTSAHALALYEKELEKYLDDNESEIVRQRTREIAQRIGCPPLAIYEVAYSECGLDPFRIRDDGIAAGWIQFTRIGSTGITTLQQVKAACKARNTKQIMDWTESYFVSRANGAPLPDATAVYVCVFAPGFIGMPDETVLYEGFDNPAYYENKIFDGYYVKVCNDGRRQIFRSESEQDGKITIAEMRLHLEAKKARFLKRKN